MRINILNEYKVTDLAFQTSDVTTGLSDLINELDGKLTQYEDIYLVNLTNKQDLIP